MLGNDSTGALVYLLDLFCNATSGPVREAVAALFGKMMADKLNGPRVSFVHGKMACEWRRGGGWCRGGVCVEEGWERWFETLVASVP